MLRIIALVAGVLWATSAHASIIFNHSGANDPVNEGWTKLNFTTATAGPVINDQGFDAWNVTDSGGLLRYSQPVSATLTQQASVNGFIVSARIRSVPPDAADWGESVYFGGPSVWEFQVGSAANGDPLLKVLNSTGF